MSIHDHDWNFSKPGTADGQGLLTLKDVPDGTYIVTATASGYDTWEKEGVKVDSETGTIILDFAPKGDK